MTEDIGSRVRWLVDVAAVNSHDLGRVLAFRLGGDERPAVDMVERMRAGGGAVPNTEQLAVIADHCGVSPAYFGSDASTVHAVREEVLTRALRQHGIQTYAVCRMAPSRAERWEQLRAALRALRNPSCGESPLPHAPGGRDHGACDDAARRSERKNLEVRVMTVMSEEQLDALCARVVDDCGLLPPFTPRDLCERLGELRGRRIKITATDLGATTGVGHLAPTRRADRILVEEDAPGHQQELVIYHEVVHLLRDHLADGDGVTCGIAGEHGAPPADRHEWEAEVGARALARIARQPHRPNRLPRTGADDSPENNIAAAFGFM